MVLLLYAPCMWPRPIHWPVCFGVVKLSSIEPLCELVYSGLRVNTKREWRLGTCYILIKLHRYPTRASEIPSNATYLRRVRLIQGTKNSFAVILLRNHHWYEFRMVWKASELIWWMVLIFLVTAIWSSSEAALTHSGLACIFIIFCCATVYHEGYGRTEQCDDDHTHTHSLSLSLSSTRVCASLFQRQRAISPIHLRRVRLIQGTQKIR